MNRRKRTPFLFFTIIAALMILLMVQFRWLGSSGSDWKHIIDGDGKGYYAYLEQIFIDGNFGEAKPDYNHINEHSGRGVIKFYSGTAIMIFPFFMAAKTLAETWEFPADAYGEMLQKSVSLAALFYLILGLVFLYKLLRQLQIRRLYAIITVSAVLFATNLLVYAVHHPSVSHVYSFCIISVLLWTFRLFVNTGKWKYVVATAFLLGLGYLLRPTHIIIVVFLPFFFVSLNSAWNFLKVNFPKFAVMLLIALVVAGVQNLLWYVQTGSFFLNPYHFEGFYFLHPEIYNVLFSFRKGWFIFTPVAMIFLTGLIAVFIKNKFQFFFAAAFTLILIYIVSAWWCWSYFDGFGMRPFIDFYGVFAIFPALLLQQSRRWLRVIVAGACTLALGLNLIQSFQYSAGIIHREYMNFANYKYVFLQTSSHYVDCIGGMADLITYDKFHKQLIAEKEVIPDTTLIFKDEVYTRAWEEEKAFVFDAWAEFNHDVRFENITALYQANRLYAEISFKKKDIAPNSSSRAMLVVSLTYPGKTREHHIKALLNPMPGQPAGQWVEYNHSVIIPKITSPEYKLWFYAWNVEFQDFLIKDMKVRIYRTA